jgi:chromosome partitioning protein
MLGRMNLAVVANKGGVGKTTTAIHLAAYLQGHGPTLLVDGDLNRSATGWARRGHVPFQVVDETAVDARGFTHVVLDTAARPAREDLNALADRVDLLVIPTTADAMALEAVAGTVSTLQSLGITRFKVLLTIVPPRPSRDAEDARATLKEWKYPTFKRAIRRLVASQKAALAGCVVHEAADPRAPWGWADYTAVGKEFKL